MLLLKRFKYLFVAFLLLSASPTTLSHDQDYQFMDGDYHGVQMSVACCTITLVTMILLVCFLVTHAYMTIQTGITTSRYMCRFLERLLVAFVIIGTCTLIDSLLDDSSSHVFHHEDIWNTTSFTSSIPTTLVGGRSCTYTGLMHLSIVCPTTPPPPPPPLPLPGQTRVLNMKFAIQRQI